MEKPLCCDALRGMPLFLCTALRYFPCLLPQTMLRWVRIPKEVLPMRIRFLALLLALALMLTGCGYLLVEDAPVQVSGAWQGAD